MSNATYVTVKLVHIECSKCHMVFGVTSGLYERVRRSHEKFWCPCGHTQHFPTESCEEKLQVTIEHKQAMVDNAERRFRHQCIERRHAEHQLRATKGVVTKLKKRVAAGVCPCCNRTFKQLARHMTKQHPDYVENPDG